MFDCRLFLACFTAAARRPRFARARAMSPDQKRRRAEVQSLKPTVGTGTSMKTGGRLATPGHGSRRVGKGRARWALMVAIVLSIVGTARPSRGEDVVWRQMPDEGRRHVAPGTHVDY